MKQYCEVLTRKLENNIDRYAEQGIRGGATIKLPEIEGAQAIKDTARLNKQSKLNVAMVQRIFQSRNQRS